MKTETELKLKYGIWGLIAGAVGAMIIGFNWGAGRPVARRSK